MLDNGPFRATISCVDASQFTMEAADLRDAYDRGQTFEESVRDRQAVSVYPESSSCIQSQTLWLRAVAMTQWIV